MYRRYKGGKRETKVKRTRFQTVCRKRNESASSVDFLSHNSYFCQSRASMQVLALIRKYSKRRKVGMASNHGSSGQRERILSVGMPELSGGELKYLANDERLPCASVRSNFSANGNSQIILTSCWRKYRKRRRKDTKNMRNI